MVQMRRVDTIHSGLDGGPFFSSMFFTFVIGEAADAANAVATFWAQCASAMSTGLTSQVVAEQTILEDTTGVISAVESSTISSSSGLEASALAPAATQGLVRLRTGTFRDGREIRGRLFIPGVTEGFNDAGKPTSGYIGDIEAAATQLRTGSASFGPWRVWSRPRPASEGVPAREGQSAVVSATSVWSEWSVLRSRRD